MCSEKCVDGVGHSLDLLNLAIVNDTELKDTSISWREKSSWVWIKWSNSWLQFAVKELCEVRIDVKIWFCDFVQATEMLVSIDFEYLGENELDAENPRV